MAWHGQAYTQLCVHVLMYVRAIERTHLAQIGHEKHLASKPHLSTQANQRALAYIYTL